MNKYLSLIIIFFFALIVSACNNATNADEKNIVIKMGTKMPKESLEGQMFEYFADTVHENSNGEITIQLYPAEQLGKGTTQVDNILNGTQQIYAEGITYFSDLDPRVNLSSVPFLFRDFEHYQKFNKSELGQDIHNTLIENNVRIINDERNFKRGPERVLLSKEPVVSVDDLKGLKIRSFESKTYSEAYTHVASNPTVIAWTETYLALNQNLVDAATSPLSLVWGMKFTEVAPHMSMVDEYQQDIVLAMNEEFFQGLTDEHKNILINAANKTGEVNNDRINEVVDEQLALMQEEHDIKIHEINKVEWSEAFEDFHYQMEEDGIAPKGTIDSIKSIE